jgi:hypothetical protein
MSTERDEACIDMVLAVLEIAAEGETGKRAFSAKLSILLGLAVHLCAEAGFTDRDKLSQLMCARFDDYEREVGMQ